MDRRTLVALVLLAAPLLAVTGGTLYVAANERSQRTFFRAGVRGIVPKLPRWAMGLR